LHYAGAEQAWLEKLTQALLRGQDQIAAFARSTLTA